MKNDAIAGYPDIHFYSNVEFLEFLLDEKSIWQYLEEILPFENK